MVNESMPWQLTVKELKESLEAADDHAVVCFKVPKGGIGHEELSVLLNLKVQNNTGPVFSFIPSGPSENEQ